MAGLGDLKDEEPSRELDWTAQTGKPRAVLEM